MGDRKPLHFNEAMQLLDIARDARQRVSLRAWDSHGNVIDYRGWLVSSSSWRKGWHRIANPVSSQVRTVPDILIFNVNGHPIYL